MTFEYEKTSPVRWAQRRHTLACYLYELASPAVQQQRWIEGKEAGPGLMSGLDFVVHFLFDDTELAENPEGTIGDILLDDLEVAAIRNVSRTLDQAMKDVGRDKADLDYISSRSWSPVVLAAQKAYRLLRPRMLSEGDNLLPPELEPKEIG
jgi:hypothetical protein